MKSVIALALAGAAIAGPTGPPAYGPPPPAYGAEPSLMPEHDESSSMAPAYSSSAMPAHEESSMAPVYSSSSMPEHESSSMPPVYSSSSEHVPSTTEPPVYSSTPAPVHNTTSMEHPSDVYVTAIVTSFTTYCPKATTLTYDQKTYTVTSATTLTITQCPGGCHITCPVQSLPPTIKTVTSEGTTVTTTVPAETVTAVVPEYTTVVPEPTTITVSNKPYTVTSSSQTITVTAPTTVTMPVSVYTSQYSSVMAAPVYTPPPGVAPPVASGAPPAGNATTSAMMPVQSGNAPARLIGSGAAALAAVFGGVMLL